MGSTVRYRFVAFDLAPGWIELSRKPRWELRHPERQGTLILSVFPVADGVTMDLAMLLYLEREGRRRNEDSAARMAAQVPASHRPWMMRRALLDESTWSMGSVFCLTSRHTWEVPAEQADHLHYQANWSVSDGHYMVEARFGDVDPVTFGASVTDCDAMMRSIRFEGPS